MQPILIAHRANLRGPCKDRENSPSYIDEAIAQGYDVEVDVRLVDGAWWLGHDGPEHMVDIHFLLQRKDRLWVHAKTPATMAALRKYHPSIHAFEHDREPYTATTNGTCWAYPGMAVDPLTVCVMPERARSAYSDRCLMRSKGICTDYPALHRQRAQATRRIAVLMSGRLTCLRTDFVPTIENFLQSNPATWVDVYISLNGGRDALDEARCRTTEPYFRSVSSSVYTAPAYLHSHPARAGETNAQNTMSMFFNNREAYRLLSCYTKAYQQTKYDLVIKYRPDIQSDLHLFDIQDPEEGCVYVPEGSDYGGVNDQVAAGTVEAMAKYCSAFDDIEQRVDEEGYRIHPETILAKHLEREGVSVHRVRFDYSLNPKRSDPATE